MMLNQLSIFKQAFAKEKEKSTALAFLKRLQSVQMYPRLSSANIELII